MLREKRLLFLPGPTPVPPRVQAAMAMPMVNHRGPEFSALHGEIARGLQALFRTREEVYVLPGSGSGGFEAALVNFVPAGARVLAVSIGDFGDRWARAAAALGYRVERLEFPPGTAADPEALRERLRADTGREIRAVLITHNETSTGVTNPLAELAAVVREHGALVLVDSVSGLGAMPLEMDAWGLDVVFTGAQKALMLPPGLTIIAASARAWAAAEEVDQPRYFFDLRPYRRGHRDHSVPYTPALSLLYGLRESLRMIEEQGGVEAAWARHRLLGAMCRAGVKALGLELLCRDERYASGSVTAVKVPPGVDPSGLRRVAREEFGAVLAPGQGKLKDAIFRIGHLGYATPHDVIAAVAAVEMALVRLGHPVPLGRGVAAAQTVWLDHLAAEKGDRT